MQQFMPEDLSREHRQMLNEEAAHARLVNLVRTNKREDQRKFSASPFSVWRLVSVRVKERLQRHSQITVKTKPVTAGS